MFNLGVLVCKVVSKISKLFGHEGSVIGGSYAFKIDKDILRIAIAELLFIEGVPVKVVVDEALELAKKYSTDDSSSFINGILGKVIDEKKDQ